MPTASQDKFGQPNFLWLLCVQGGYIRISDFQPLSRRISGTVQNRTNGVINTRFRLVPKSTTLVDLELTLNGHCALCYIIHVFFGAHCKNLNEDGSILSAAKM